MNVFFMTSDKLQMKLRRMYTKCHSLHNKNYSLQYDLVADKQTLLCEKNVTIT